MDRRKFLKFGLASGATLMMTPALLDIFKPPEKASGVYIDGVNLTGGDQILVKGTDGCDGLYTYLTWKNAVGGPWALPNDEVGTARMVGHKDCAFIMTEDGWVEFKDV